MTLLTPEQIEAVIKETIKVTSQNPAWREAIVTVMKTPNLPTITKAASSVNMSVSSFIRHFNVACWKAEEIIRPLLKEAKIFTTDEIDDLVIQGRILYRSGIPDVMRAGAGAGGAGAAATGAAAGKGAIILKGLAILGGLIAFAVVSYYVAGYLGELAADKPIEPGWNRPVYGDFIATMDGVDVTNALWSEPGQIYVIPWADMSFYNHNGGGREVYTKTFGEMCVFLNEELFRDIYGNQNYFTYMVATRDRSVSGGWRHDKVICDREILK